MIKSSYKLFGSAWDRQPIPEKCPVVKLSERNIDGPFLKLSEQMVEKKHEKDVLNENMFLIVDFIPRTKSTVIWDFYLKRLLQIAEYYQTKTMFYSDSDYIDQLNERLKNFYKRKAPKRSLAQSVGASQMIC